MSTSFFSYTSDQARKIHQALTNEGMSSDADWPRYLDAITKSMGAARHMAARSKQDAPPYAPQAVRRLETFIEALAALLQQYQDLGPTLQSTVHYHLPKVTLLNPLLINSLHASERLVVERLLSSHRFPLMLETIRTAGAMAAAELRGANKPSDNALFPVPSAPKNHAIRFAARGLWGIYEEATGKTPKMYANAHETEGHGGGFYKFAAAALGPAHLVDKKVLGSNILTAYNEFRRWLKRDNPEKKVKTPR